MKRLVLIIGLMFAGVGSLWAQEVKDLGQIVVTPDRYVSDASEAGSYVTVITRRDIAASGAFTLPDLLVRQAGVHVYNKGSQKSSVIDMGGYNDAAVSNVLVMQNGRRLNPSDSSGPDLAQIPLDTIERIEIVRGGASVLYGDNAVGGVVNIITRSGHEGVNGSIATELGSYDRKKLSADVSAGKKDLTVYVFGGTERTNGYRTNNAFQASDGQVRLNWKAVELLSLGIEAGWHEDDYGLPSGLHADQLGSLGRRGSRTPDDFGDTRDRYLRLTSEWKPFDASGEFGTLSLDYTHRDRDTYGFYYYTSPEWEFSKTGILNDSANLKYRIEKDIAGRKAGLTTGVDVVSDRSHVIDQYNPWSLQDVNIAKKEQGYYFLAQYDVLDKLTADIGGRHEKADYTFISHDMGTKDKTAPTANVWGGGLKYDYAQGSNVFIRADETFRFLNTDEYFSRWTGLNTTLRQQTGIDYRAGVKHAFGEVFEARLTPFMTLNKEEIFLDPTVSPGNNNNYGRTRRLGVDLGQTFHMVPALKVAGLRSTDINVDYTYLDAEFSGGSFGGKRLPMTPRHQVSVGMNIAAKSGLSLNVMGRFLGAQYGINDDANRRAPIKARVIADTRLGYAFNPNWDTFVGVNNVFDKRYYEYVAFGAGASTNIDYYPAIGRNYVAGMKYKF
ncbi:MAG: TonB-dependent receptor [Candidatus Omnitrophica bacterium]|nr:TonB-dependent receptor [Candidatus Omnitrophota bacterium]